MKKRTIRKHSGLIKCWAEGYDIQVLTSKGWLDIVDPRWDDACEYRIKDEYTHLREAIKAGKKVYYVTKTYAGLERRELCVAYKRYIEGKGGIETSFLYPYFKPERYVIEEPIKYEPFNCLEDLKSILGKKVEGLDSVGMITGGNVLSGELEIYTGDSSIGIKAHLFLEYYTFEDGTPCGKLVE